MDRKKKRIWTESLKSHRIKSKVSCLSFVYPAELRCFASKNSNDESGRREQSIALEEEDLRKSQSCQLHSEGRPIGPKGIGLAA